MDAIFKQKLLTLRNPSAPLTFSAALLGTTEWGTKKAPAKIVNTPEESFSEKKQVLESLERFAQEQTAEHNTSVLKFDRGEVHVKAEPEWKEAGQFDSLDALRGHLGLEKSFLDIVLAGKDPKDVKVLFVTEKFRNWSDVQAELKSGFINELICGLPVKTAELFERMIMAMKLLPSEVIVYPVEGSEEKDFAQDVMEAAAFFNPEVIITLGAKATQKILKSNDRLSLVHGEFFSRKVGDSGTFQVVPLFHPTIIERNQNMKKTAWADMQKIMKFLKKIP